MLLEENEADFFNKMIPKYDQKNQKRHLEGYTMDDCNLVKLISKATRKNEFPYG